VRATLCDSCAPYPVHRVNRQFKGQRPSQLWISDFTDALICQGWSYVTFVTFVYALAESRVGSSVGRCTRNSFWMPWIRRCMPGKQSVTVS